MNQPSNESSISTDEIKTSESITSKNLFVKSFWWTIIVLFLITLIMLVLSVFNSSEHSLEQAANQRAYEELSDELLAAIPDYVGEVMTKVVNDPFPKTEKVINDSVDEAFSFVYKNIPKFADTHYSVLGEYVEIGMGASGKLSSHIQKQLFSGLESRLETASNKVSDTLNSEILEKIDSYVKEVTEKPSISKSQKQAFEEQLSIELRKHLSMTRNAASMGGGGALGAITGVTAVKLIAANVSRKLLIKLGAKYSAKLAAKSVSTASIAAAGAAIGSFVPVVGTAAGGIIGATIGWFTMDAAFVTVDEWLNREEFELDLRNLITQQKNKIKQYMKREVNKIKEKLTLDERESLTGKTPSTL